MRKKTHAIFAEAFVKRRLGNVGGASSAILAQLTIIRFFGHSENDRKREINFVFERKRKFQSIVNWDGEESTSAHSDIA